MTIPDLVRREDFPASLKSTYFNAASISPMYAEAARVLLAWQQDLAENGTLHFDEKAEEEVFDALHAAFARLINAEAKDIAVGSSATELMSSFAWGVPLQMGQNVIGTDAAHPSTIYPWRRVAEQSGCELRLVKGDGNGYIDPAEVAGRIDDRTAVVSISHVEYRTGQTYDLTALARRAHAHGAILAVDATQSAGQVPLDVRASPVDVLVSSAYKWLCGPFGVAVMYVAPHWQERLRPGIVGWRSHTNMWEFRADRLEYPKTARRFEASTMAYGCALGMAKAVEYLAQIGAPKILAHNQALADLLGRELLSRGAELVSPQREAERSSIISIRFPGRKADEIARRLNAADVVVSHRMGAIRISPHLYNNESDVWRAVETFDAILA